MLLSMNILIDINTCIPSLDLNKFLFPILLFRCYLGSTQRVRPPSPARLSPWWVGPRSAETVRTNTTYKPSWTPMLSLTNSTSWTHARLSIHWQTWYVMPGIHVDWKIKVSNIDPFSVQWKTHIFTLFPLLLLNILILNQIYWVVANLFLRKN